MKKISIFVTFFALLILIFSASSVYAENNIINKEKVNNSGFSTQAQSAVVIEANSNRILYEKNSKQKLPMASTTKIITAMTVINNANLSDVVTIDKNSVGVEGSSVYLREGEQLTVSELLYCLMLRSGNDSAIALANFVSGSVDSFAILMNNYAKSVGANESNFVNPHGLHNENHYTTAQDLALISSDAIKNSEFEKLSNCESIVIADGKENRRHLVNKNKLLSIDHDNNGIKTGYTKNAGRCFVSAKKSKDMQIVSVVLNCNPMFEDCQSMMNYAISNYTNVNIIPNNYITSLEHNGKTIQGIIGRSFNYPIKNNSNELDDIKVSLECGEFDKIVKIGQEIGNIRVMMSNQLIFSEKVCSIDTVN